MIESKNINEIIRDIATVSKSVKVQVSPGEKVSAACGQFIVTEHKPA